MADEAKRCEHLNFGAQVNVTRLARSEGDPITGYVADITIHCTECKKPFQFLGLEPGVDSQGARVSLDGLEAHLALSPQGEKPNPFHRMAFGVRAFQ